MASVGRKKLAGYGWKDEYGTERERYYNRNGWGIEAPEEREGEEEIETEI